MIIIKNGTVVNADRRKKVDVKINEDKIVEIKNNIEPNIEDKVIDANGCYLFPGFIDAHTHLEMNTGTAWTSDTFETATRAAVVGGTTTVVDFACQDKGDTLNTALDEWFRRARDVSSCNYGFHMSITDWNETTKSEIADMTRAGVTSYKLYMAYPALRIPDNDIYEILKVIHEDVHGITGTHCENGDLVDELISEQIKLGHLSTSAHPLSRPDYVEAEATARYLYIAGLAQSPVNIVHITSQYSFNEGIKARERGQKVYMETCPQYLLLDDSKYDLPSFESAKYVCSPPLRDKVNNSILWNALKEGKIDTIATDNCSFMFKGQKDVGISDFSKIPNGMPGVQLRPSLIYTYGVDTGILSLEQMVQYLSENEAKLFGMFPQKGIIKEGSDADIVIWNPDTVSTVSVDNQLQTVDYTPYEGFKTVGLSKYVILNGEVVVKDGELIKEKRGTYVPRGESIYF